MHLKLVVERKNKKKKVCLSLLLISFFFINNINRSGRNQTCRLRRRRHVSSFTKSNICSTISCGVVTCHLPNVRLLLCPTAVVKIASDWIDNGTAGESSFPGRSVVARAQENLRVTCGHYRCFHDDFFAGWEEECSEHIFVGLRWRVLNINRDWKEWRRKKRNTPCRHQHKK